MPTLSNIGLFIDFGSTYTKIVALDLDDEKIVGVSHSASTVDVDIMIGLQTALDALMVNGEKLDISRFSIKLACSSAAGGLRLVVAGLVPADEAAAVGADLRGAASRGSIGGLHSTRGHGADRRWRGACFERDRRRFRSPGESPAR